MRLWDRLIGYRDARRRVFHALPWRSKLLFYVVVFCCFAPLGILQNVTMLGAVPARYVCLHACFWGGFGLLAAVMGLRAPKYLPFGVAVGLLAVRVFTRWAPTFHAPTSFDAAEIAAVQKSLGAIVGVATGLIVVAYASLVSLVTREGRRYGGAHAEIQLAHRIHTALVPPLACKGASLAWRGVSHPSGEVGGDLVDVIDSAGINPAWIGCVADVSGHGVAAGLLMGMFKTALHGAVDDAPDAGALVTRVNAVLAPLSEPNMFVTSAVLRRVGARMFEYVLAGHPPLLCWRARDRRTEWVGESQFAVGLMPDTRYEARTLVVATSDLVIALTDGLLEVVDRADRELGRAGLARALDGIDAATPLDEVERRLFEACRHHGQQVDDQTLLIVQVQPEGA